MWTCHLFTIRAGNEYHPLQSCPAYRRGITGNNAPQTSETRAKHVGVLDSNHWIATRKLASKAPMAPTKANTFRLHLLQVDASESRIKSGISIDQEEAGQSKPRKPTPLHLKYVLIGTNQVSAAPMSSIDCGQLADWIDV